MSGRNLCCNAFLCDAREKLVTQPPPGIFQVPAMMLCFFPNVLTFTNKLKTACLCEFLHKSLIRVRISAAQLVIQVKDAEGYAQFGAQVFEDSQERDRVRAAGNGNSHPVPGIEHAVLANGRKHPAMQW